jgi:endonuclease/exonuclease/phosphatase family metal-dependent hydrolase
MPRMMARLCREAMLICVKTKRRVQMDATRSAERECNWDVRVQRGTEKRRHREEVEELQETPLSARQKPRPMKV